MRPAPEGTGADRAPAAPRFLSEGDGHRLLHQLRRARAAGCIAQLIAARSGEGVSSLARDIALLASARPGARVLLLDLAPFGRTQLAVLGGGGATAAAGRPVTGWPASAALHQLDGLPLWVSETTRVPVTGPAEWVEALPALRQAFDLVLIDSPAIERSESGMLLAPEVDANLLVVEAERTRTAEARNLRDRIRDMGGQIAGVVLNKQRSHIPGFLLRHV